MRPGRWWWRTRVAGLFAAVIVALPVRDDAPADSIDSVNYPGIESRVAGESQERIVLVGPGDGAQRFKLTYHRQMSALSDATCSRFVDRAHWRQDIAMQWDSKRHFDNCALDEGAAFVSEMAATVREQGRRASQDPDARREALYALGYALHSIQDFYAHSTYVEMLDGRAAPSSRVQALTVIPFWTSEGREMLSKWRDMGLLSGTWLIGMPKLCPAGAKGHGDVAKDDLTTRSGREPLARAAEWRLQTRFQAAFLLARDATGRFIEDVVPDELVQACGGKLGVLVLVKDNRPE